MGKRMTAILCTLALLPLIAGCTQPYNTVTELKSFPLNSLEGVLTKSGIEMDPSVSYDGKGSLKINAGEPAVVRLFEISGLNIENAHLLYQARVRTLDVKGQVYLEMWCHFPGKGNFFSRGLDSPLTGTVDWTSAEIPFFLKKGENPDNVRLNLIINGTGVVWIDDIRLVKGPLR